MTDTRSTATTTATATAAPLLQIRDLKMHFPIFKGFFQRRVGAVRAVDGVTFTIDRGEVLGMVGESGCGKSTVAKTLVRALEPTAGSITYHPESGKPVEMAHLPEHDLRPWRREIRMIFQDPYSSMNPRMRVQEIIEEPLLNLTGMSPKDRREKVASLLERVGLRPEYRHRYPHAFSGGERQRIVIARALALDPRLVIADEAVTALDVSVRAQVLDLLKDLQRDMDLTYLFISHDLSVVRHISDRVAVMYVGKLVELATTDELYENPQHPYTEALLSAVPIPDPRLRNQGNRILLEGDVPDPSNPPPGCPFHTRCRYAQERCRTEVPPLRDVGGGHLAACHFSEELNLQGVVMRRSPNGAVIS
jgi:peptide/nickel transport system ATP-binding protein